MTLPGKLPGKCAAIVAALALSGLMGCVPATRQSIAQTQRIDQMAEDIQRLKREVHEARAPAPSSASDARLGERLAELGARVERLDHEGKGLSGKLEEFDYALKNLSRTDSAAAPSAPEIQGLKAEVKELFLRVDALTMRVNALGNSGAASTTVGAVTSQPETPTDKPVSSKDLYDRAYKLYRQGEYAKSNEGFNEYLRRFPDTALTDNAYFWIGEIYYDQRQYEQAIVQYDKVVQKFPDGDKIASAILKQAFAFSAIGDNLDARILLKKVINEHPGSEQAEIAKKKLAVIGN